MDEQNVEKQIEEYAKIGDAAVDNMIATATDSEHFVEVDGVRYVRADSVGSVCAAYMLAEGIGLPNSELYLIYTLMSLLERTKGKRLWESMAEKMHPVTAPDTEMGTLPPDLQAEFDKIIKDFKG